MTPCRPLAVLHPELKTANQRGIYLYAKSLLAALAQAHFDVTLVTDARLQGEVAADALARLYREIDAPPRERVRSLQMLPQWVARRWGWPGRLSLHEADASQVVSERSEFLRHVNHFLNSERFYEVCRLASSKPWLSPVNIDFLGEQGAEVVLTTCPVSVRSGRGRVKLIQTVHDLIALNSDMHSVSAGKYRRRVQACLDHADAIVAVSEHTRQEILALEPQAADRVHVVHQPIPANEETVALSALPQVQAEVLSRWGLQAQGYLFFVAAIEERKNIPRLIEAHRQSRLARAHPLVLAGFVEEPYERSVGAHAALFEAGGLERGEVPSGPVRYLGRIAELDKLCLLRGARLFVFPTLSEGFGIPVLEAQSMGCPVLTTNATAIPEVVGDSAALIDNPRSVEELAQALDDLVGDEGRLQALRASGLVNARRFHKAAFAARVAEVVGRV